MREVTREDITKSNINRLRFKTKEEFTKQYKNDYDFGSFNTEMMSYLYGRKLREFPPVRINFASYFIPKKHDAEDTWIIDYNMLVFYNENLFETEE